MKLIIAGSRNIHMKLETLNNIVESIKNNYGIKIDEVVSGGCKGVDETGEKWAKSLNIPVKKFPADWRLGLGAGPIRNKQMAEYGDALLLVWNGNSKGSASMKKEMEKVGKTIYEIINGKEK